MLSNEKADKTGGSYSQSRIEVDFGVVELIIVRILQSPLVDNLPKHTRIPDDAA